jgi:NAD(P)-dependent dehydrogenase (short-subunit alcohol dehydrogenase family)
MRLRQEVQALPWGAVGNGALSCFIVEAWTTVTEAADAVIEAVIAEFGQLNLLVNNAPLQEILGQPIVVENRAGGSNIIATDAIVRSPPDGYIIGTIISVHASNVALQPKLPYDSIKDITPIAFLGYVGNIVVVHPAVKTNSMQELIALAKANP